MTAHWSLLVSFFSHLHDWLLLCCWFLLQFSLNLIHSRKGVVKYSHTMMAPRSKPLTSPIMSPPRPQMDFEEYANISQTLTQESSIISTTQTYYSKQYSKYKTKKIEAKALALNLTYQHFIHWQKKHGVDNVNSHLTRNEFQVRITSLRCVAV